MNIDEINEIRACLPRSRTVFYYFKDRYALELLADYVQTTKPIRVIKQSPYTGLLNKPIVKEVVSNTAQGVVSRDSLQAVWPEAPLAFTLSLGRWGHKKGCDYYQTSRPGYNLVLHLNFSNQHDNLFRKVHLTSEDSPFGGYAHPHNTKGRDTLAWARLDIDMDRGEALIEEIQNDWLRDARDDRKLLLDYIRRYNTWAEISTRWPFSLSEYANVNSIDALLHYFDSCIKSYEQIWDEAMLYAAIWFIRKELGIKRIFYHSWLTGCRIKRIEEKWAPPRSIYTQLPKRFCFQETNEYPEMVYPRVRHVRNKWKNFTPRWYQSIV